MKTYIKRGTVLLLVSLLLVTAFGCGKSGEYEETIKGLTWENESLREELAKTKGELSVYQNATPAPVITPAPVVTPEPQIIEKEVEVEVVREVPTEYAFGVNCLINGHQTAVISGETKVTVTQYLPAGMAFDGWKVDGEDVGNAEELTLILSRTTLIEAVCHPEKKITCINCYFQYPNAKDRAAGDKLETVTFETEYTNPNTKQTCEGGRITGYVTANVPKNKTVDYWIINGVEYHFNNTVKYFRIVDLDEATTYEVVFKGSTKKRSSVPDPTPYRKVPASWQDTDNP